jgi:hypothetical protein
VYLHQRDAHSVRIVRADVAAVDVDAQQASSALVSDQFRLYAYLGSDGKSTSSYARWSARYRRGKRRRADRGAGIAVRRFSRR